MARVNITVPDDTLARARAAGLTISQVATRALDEALARRAAVDEAYRYLAELEEEHGPVTPEDKADARAWLEEGLRSRAGTTKERRSA